MEHENHDKKFVATFGIVLAALGAIFFICIIAARIIIPEPGPDPEALAQLEKRIRPVAMVFTDPAALVKVAAAKPERAALSGEQVLTKVCNTCHVSGLLAAPKNGDKVDWTARSAAAGGLDGLTASAIKGKNSMPARGGDPDLSDAEIKAAVTLMVGASGV